MEGQAVIRRHDVLVGRVLSREDDHVVIEVPRDMGKPFEVHEGDEFLTLVFVKPEGTGLNSWNPVA